MKTITAAVASSLLLALPLLVSTNASADNTPARPAVAVAQGMVIVRPVGWALTTVKGTIKTPGGTPTNPAGFGCGDISVSASSKEMVQPTDGFAHPKWMHYGTATGNWSGGSCTYSFSVPPNSAFNLQLGWGNHQACDVIYGLNVTPGITGPFTLAKGGTKVQDYTMTGTPQCHWVP